MTMWNGKINDRWDLVLPDFRVEFHATRPKWEAGRLAHMFERVRPGWVIYDVGAEQGDFTALYRQWVGDLGTVVPVEPSLLMWPIIRQTWDANFTDTPDLCFVGFASDLTNLRPEIAEEFSEGICRARWPRAADAAGPLIADPGFRHLAQQANHTQQARIDFLAYSGEDAPLIPDAVVLDIEGAEWHALRGLGRIVEAGHWPECWVSVHRPPLADWYGKTLGDIERLMRDYGYGPGTLLESFGEGEEFWHWAEERF